MNSLSIHTKLETLPPDLKEEVNNFIDFLINKSLNEKKRALFLSSEVRKEKSKCLRILTSRWMTLRIICNELLTASKDEYRV
jgi:hypothetical protein